MDINEKAKIWNSMILEAQENIFNEDLEKARNILNQVLKEIGILYKENEKTKYYFFTSPLNFVIFIEYNKIFDPLLVSKKIIWPEVNLCLLYNLLSHIAISYQKYDQALVLCDKAIACDPFYIDNYFKKASIYKEKREWEHFKKINFLAYNYILDKKDMALFYKNLGYYFWELNELEITINLFSISYMTNKNDSIINELANLNKITGKKSDTISDIKEIEKTLKNLNLLVGIEKRLLKILLRTFENIKLDLNIKKELGHLLFDYYHDLTFLSYESPNIIIQSDLIFDFSRIIETDNDIKRKNRSIEILKEMNLNYIEDLKLIPREKDTILSPKKLIWEKLLHDFTIAYLAILIKKANYSALECYNEVVTKMDLRYGILSLFNEPDKTLLKKMTGDKFDPMTLDSFTLYINDCAINLWMLGLIDKPNSKTIYDINKIADLILYDVKPININKYNIKPKEEVLDFCDLVFRYYWACVEIREKNIKDTSLNEKIVYRQKKALTWLLSWDEKLYLRRSDY